MKKEYEQPVLMMVNVGNNVITASSSQCGIGVDESAADND